MKNLKAFSRAGAPLPSESRIESNTSPHQSPPFASLSISKHLLPAGVLLLLLGLVLSAPIQAQKLDVSTKSLEVIEGQSVQFTIRLKKKPSSDATVTLQLDSTDIKVDTKPEKEGYQNTLTFTPADWSTHQTVKVTAATDNEDKNDEEVQITISSTSSKKTKSVRITVLDDDKDVELDLNKSSLNLHEGASVGTSGTAEKFKVKLSSNPIGSRTVSLGSKNSDITFSPTSLTFTSSNWNERQTVMVGANQDADMKSETSKLKLTGTNVVAESVTVSVQDDEDFGVYVSNGTLEVNEGSTVTFNVRLLKQPAFSRTVGFNLFGEGKSQVTLDTASLVFTPANWSTLQTVTVRAGQDANASDDTVTIYPQLQKIKSGVIRWEDITASSVAVSVKDDDLGFKFQNDELRVNEGQSGIFSVRLTKQPEAATMITISQPVGTDVTVDTDTGTDGNQNTLNFTTDNWRTFQPVKVNTVHDTDKTDDIVAINLTGGGVISASVRVSVIDDDDVAIGLNLSKTKLTVNEGASATFRVALASKPGKNRNITLTVSENPDITVSPTSLTLTGSNWEQGEIVTVNAAQDEDKADDSATIQFSGAGITPGSTIAVTVDDSGDTGSVGLSLEQTQISVDEGSTNRLKVALNAVPANSRTIQLSSNNSDVTLNPTSLTFTRDDWQQKKPVTVRAEQDSDADNDTAIVTLQGSGITSTSATVTVIDDDFGLSLSTSSLTLNESGNALFTVSLLKQPSANVTVSLASNKAGVKFALGTDIHVSQLNLTFTALNWNLGQSVQLHAVEDNDSTDENATISLAASGGGYDNVTDSVSVTVLDNDQLILSTTNLKVVEGGSQNFWVRLKENPGKNVIISLTKYFNPDVTFDTDLSTPGNQSSLTFMSSNWSANQKVKVIAAEDSDRTDESAHIQVRSPNGVLISVTVRVLDNDVRLTLSSTSLRMDEGGSQIFTVRLTDQPRYSREIDLSSGNSDIRVSPASLSFTKDNWSATQNVTVTAVQDSDKTDESTIISLGGTGAVSYSVSVTVADDDDDDVELRLSAASIKVHEGTEGSFSVKLRELPGKSRTITLTSSNADVQLDETSLTFTRGNWSVYQVVEFTVAQDSDTIHDTLSVGLSGVGVVSASLSVSIIDDDVGLLLSRKSISMTEGQSESFTIRLSTRPRANWGVNLTSNNSDATLTKSGLTFTQSNWNTPRTVSVRVAHDSNKADEKATISITGTGTGTDAGQTASDSVRVSVTDDDDTNVGLVVTSSSLSVYGEGGSVSFSVRLASKPGNTRSISVSSSLQLSKTSLTFTPSDWNQYQLVTVTATEFVVYSYYDYIYLRGSRVLSRSIQVMVRGENGYPGGILRISGNAQERHRDFAVKLAAQPVSYGMIAPILNDGNDMSAAQACSVTMEAGTSGLVPAPAVFAASPPSCSAAGRTDSGSISTAGLTVGHRGKTPGNKKNTKFWGAAGSG